MAAPATMRQAALQQSGNGDPLAQKGARDPAGAAQPEQHRQRGAVGCRGEGGEGEQQAFFDRGNLARRAATSRNSDSTDRPAKMSVSSMLASQGSAVVRISARLIAASRNGLSHAEHAQRQLQDPQRRQRLNTRD